MLGLNSGPTLHPSEEHLKANYVTTPREGSSKSSSFSLFLEDAPLLSFATSYIPRLLVHPKKKKEREKTVGLGGRNHDVTIKHLVTQPGNAPKTRPSHLTTADMVNKVSLKDSPSKTAKAESFRGGRPWLWHSNDTAMLPCIERKWSIAPFIKCLLCAFNPKKHSEYQSDQ